jgi:hypothetical protein
VFDPRGKENESVEEFPEYIGEGMQQGSDTNPTGIRPHPTLDSDER